MKALSYQSPSDLTGSEMGQEVPTLGLSVKSQQKVDSQVASDEQGMELLKAPKGRF